MDYIAHGQVECDQLWNPGFGNLWVLIKKSTRSEDAKVKERRLPYVAAFGSELKYTCTDAWHAQIDGRESYW